MAMKTVILAHGNPFNREVCGDSVIYFEDTNDLKEKMEKVDSNVMDILELKEKAYQRVMKEYSWDKVVKDYDLLMRNKNGI